MELIRHYSRCKADHPEKPQQEEIIDLGDGRQVRQCVDCGAFVVERKPPPLRVTVDLTI